MSDVKMPQLGETVAEGTVTRWLKKVGENVEKGEPLLEIATDKVDTEIPSQFTGLLHSILITEGTTVDVGTTLAIIQVEGEEISEAAAPTGADSTATPAKSKASKERTARADADQRLSPVVRRLLEEHGLSASEVPSSGERLTRDDVLTFVASRGTAGSGRSTTSSPGTPSVTSPLVRRLLENDGTELVSASGLGGRVTRRDAEKASFYATAGPDDDVIAFNRIRSLTAEHMAKTKIISPHTLMVREIDYEKVEEVRRQSGAAFKERGGFSLTYLPFLALATLDALRDFPRLNASVGRNELIVHRSRGLAIAVDLGDDGLVAPVLRNGDDLTVTEMARQIRDIAVRARSKSLTPQDFAGGTFTISNPGPYGTLITGALINQPQVAILATDGVKRRPVVIEAADGSETIGIHSIGLVALNFDHRAVDGGYGAQFLARLDAAMQSDWATRL